MAGLNKTRVDLQHTRKRNPKRRHHNLGHGGSQHPHSSTRTELRKRLRTKKKDTRLKNTQGPTASASAPASHCNINLKRENASSTVTTQGQAHQLLHTVRKPRSTHRNENSHNHCSYKHIIIHWKGGCILNNTQTRTTKNQRELSHDKSRKSHMNRWSRTSKKEHHDAITQGEDAQKLKQHHLEKGKQRTPQKKIYGQGMRVREEWKGATGMRCGNHHRARG